MSLLYIFFFLLIMCLLHLQDEISFRLDVPMDGDSVDEETGTHDVMMTVPPNQVQLSYTRFSMIYLLDIHTVAPAVLASVWCQFNELVY